VNFVTGTFFAIVNALLLFQSLPRLIDKCNGVW